MGKTNQEYVKRTRSTHTHTSIFLWTKIGFQSIIFSGKSIIFNKKWWWWWKEASNIVNDVSNAEYLCVWNRPEMLSVKFHKSVNRWRVRDFSLNQKKQERNVHFENRLSVKTHVPDSLFIALAPLLPMYFSFQIYWRKPTITRDLAMQSRNEFYKKWKRKKKQNSYFFVEWIAKKKLTIERTYSLIYTHEGFGVHNVSAQWLNNGKLLKILHFFHQRFQWKALPKRETFYYLCSARRTRNRHTHTQRWVEHGLKVIKVGRSQTIKSMRTTLERS